MRQIAAKALILSLAVIIAAILIAPQVDLDPIAPRLEWAACLLIVFLAWLAGMVRVAALQEAIKRVFFTPAASHQLPRACSCTAESTLLRC